MQENYELVQKGFRVLHPIMAGYIGREMNKAYRDNWWTEVLLALSDQWDLPRQGEYSELIDALDIANCLRLIDRRWNELFCQNLSLNIRTWAKELMGVRNTVAHIGQQDLSQADAERALDTMARICDAFDKDGAEDIRGIYKQVRFGRDRAGMQNGEAASRPGPKPIDIPGQTGGDPIPRVNGAVNLISLIGTEIVQKTKLSRQAIKSLQVQRVRNHVQRTLRHPKHQALNHRFFNHLLSYLSTRQT